MSTTFNHVTFVNMNEAYPALIKLALECGEVARPRGFTCYELRPFHFTLLDPKRSIYCGKSRKLSARFWAIETLSYLAGLGGRKWHADLLIACNKGMRSFVNEETGTFDGAYGPRISLSLHGIIDLLRKDPDSRQAVSSIWEPGTPKPSKDIPCTVCLHFFRSKGALSLQVYMRSNDLNWGLPYDVPAFCAIQSYIAEQLDWELGEYHHSCGSLHVYENETDDKGQPGPPKIVHPLEEVWEQRGIPTIGGLGWIEPSLNRVWNHYRDTGEWLHYGYMGEPWATMISKNKWGPE